MKKRIPGFFVLLLSLNNAVLADEFTVALGVFNLASNGSDFQVSYRMDQSHWQYGYRYARWTDTSSDPFTGQDLTNTTQTLQGPVVNYLFKNESRHTPYVGVSLLNWSQTETPLALPGPSDTASTTDLYFGGSGYYNAGIYLSPTAKMKTQTAISSSDQSGNFDIQLQAGLAW